MTTENYEINERVRTILKGFQLPTKIKARHHLKYKVLIEVTDQMSAVDLADFEKWIGPY